MADEKNIPLSVLRSYSPRPDELNFGELTDDVRQNINKLANYIATAVYGVDIREAMKVAILLTYDT